MDLNSNDPYDTTNCKIAVTNSEQRQFLSKTKAAATLNLAIKGNARIYIKGLTASPFKMWDAICTQYDRADFIADYHDILEEWNKATFNAHQRIPRAWFNILDEINEKLRTAGNKKTTVDVFSYILAGIDKSKQCDNVHRDFTKFKPAEMTEVKLTELKEAVINEYLRKKKTPEDDIDVDELLSIQTDIPYFDGICHKCKKHGHRIKDCPLWKIEDPDGVMKHASPKKKRNNQVCGYCGKKGHHEKVCRKKKADLKGDDLLTLEMKDFQWCHSCSGEDHVKSVCSAKPASSLNPKANPFVPHASKPTSKKDHDNDINSATVPDRTELHTFEPTTLNLNLLVTLTISLQILEPLLTL